MKRILSILVLGLVCSLQAQLQYSGTVRDSLGQPVAGARVMVQGAADSTLTEADGTFSLSAGITTFIDDRRESAGTRNFEVLGSQLWVPDQNARLEIFNIRGRLVASQTGRLSGYPLAEGRTAGLYLARLHAAGARSAFTFVVFGGRAVCDVSGSRSAPISPLGKVAVDSGYRLLVSKAGMTRWDSLLLVQSASDLDIVINPAKYPEWSALFSRLDRGDSLTVAYLGGSITYGAFADADTVLNETASWRALVGNAFRAMSLTHQVGNVDASVGATGADLGVFRMERDVLPYHPDLTLVEFAVNGGGREALEGIITKLHRQNPNMAIGLVILGVTSNGTTYAASPNERENHLAVCANYQLPCFDLVAEITRMVGAGQTSLDSIFPTVGGSRDQTHPKVYGHKLYFEILQGMMAKAVKDSGSALSAWPAALTLNRYQNAAMVELATLSDLGGWAVGTRSPGLWFDQDPREKFSSVVSPAAVGSEVTVDSLNASLIGLYYESTKDGGGLQITVAGANRLTVSTDWTDGWDGIFGSGKAVVRFKTSFDTYNGLMKLKCTSLPQNLRAGYFLYVPK